MALVNIALCCSKAEIGVPVVVGWWGGVVQTDFHVKPTTKLHGLLLGWVGVMTIIIEQLLHNF